LKNFDKKFDNFIEESILAKLFV